MALGFFSMVLIRRHLGSPFSLLLVAPLSPDARASLGRGVILNVSVSLGLVAGGSGMTIALRQTRAQVDAGGLIVNGRQSRHLSRVERPPVKAVVALKASTCVVEPLRLQCSG